MGEISVDVVKDKRITRERWTSVVVGYVLIPVLTTFKLWVLVESLLVFILDHLLVGSKERNSTLSGFEVSWVTDSPCGRPDSQSTGVVMTSNPVVDSRKEREWRSKE